MTSILVYAGFATGSLKNSAQATGLDMSIISATFVKYTRKWLSSNEIENVLATLCCFLFIVISLFCLTVVGLHHC